MIPTIQEIIAGLVSGDFTQDQAQAWIDQHIALAVDANDHRALFAAAALEGQLANGVRKPSKDALAADCFAYADSMVACMQGAAS